VLEGALQAAWDRLLARWPVLLLLGSDLHMMERLTGYDRPFYGRADNLALGPLNPLDTGRALGLEAVEAVDAHLICGGLPGILRSWPSGADPMSFLEQECADPAAPVFSVPESALLAEFPAPDQARRVLEALGGGNRTYGNISFSGEQSGCYRLLLRWVQPHHTAGGTVVVGWQSWHVEGRRIAAPVSR